MSGYLVFQKAASYKNFIKLSGKYCPVSFFSKDVSSLQSQKKRKKKKEMKQQQQQQQQNTITTKPPRLLFWKICERLEKYRIAITTTINNKKKNTNKANRQTKKPSLNSGNIRAVPSSMKLLGRISIEFSKTHSKHIRTSKMKLFAKIINSWKLLIIFAKGFILHVSITCTPLILHLRLWFWVLVYCVSVLHR